MATKAASDILEEVVTRVALGDLKPYRKNPRKGNIGAIVESLKENGQFRPLIVQRSTNEILGGNHTYYGAKQLKWKTIKVVYVDVDDNAAAKIVLADNRTSDLATYDSEILAEIIKSIDTPSVGTGYTASDVSAVLAAIEENNEELLNDVISAAPRVQMSNSDDDDDDYTPTSFEDKIEAAKDRAHEQFGDDYMPEQDNFKKGSDEAQRAQAELQKYLEAKEDTIYEFRNYWGIPQLRRDMLVESLPEKIDTWGQKDATPDDGETTWFWNTGLASPTGLPYDRTVMSFWTYDDNFAKWFTTPGYYVSRVYTRGIRQAVVPDTSFWLDAPRVNHLANLYDAQWLGRFMQEAGIRVIPRIQFTDLESVKYGILGIPKNAPIVSFCTQTSTEKELNALAYPECLRLAIEELKPDCLLVYSGPPGRRMVEGAKLPKSLEVRFLENYAAKRRGVAYDNPDGVKGEKKKSKSKSKPPAEEQDELDPDS